MKLQSSVLVDK